MRYLLVIAATMMLAACVRMVPDTAPKVAVPLPPGTVSSAAFSPLVRGVDVDALGITPDDAGTALVSFLESCPAVLTREDQSGLTFAEDWRPACEAATSWPVSDARRFFTSYFETARVGDGAAFATGYFEPEIRGSRTRAPGYDVPIYAPPPELVRAWPEDMPESERTGRPPLGRYDASGKFVLFYDRTQIELGALANRGLEIAWAADPVEFFFLQIQGSGLVRLPNGELMRIGYAAQNGREYVGIGRVMRERGMIGEGTPYATSMQGIMAYIRDNPADGRDIMRLNKRRPAGFAWRTRAARSLGRGRSAVRPLRGAGLPRHGSPGRRRPVDRAGYGRRDQGRQPLRYLLGQWRRCARDRGRHERARVGAGTPATRHARPP